VFVYDEGATRINLLYDTAEERIAAETAATIAAFQANAERVGINGSGGVLRAVTETRAQSLKPLGKKSGLPLTACQGGRSREKR
jgi:hypothetical protein